MALLNKIKKSVGNLIPVIGIESSPESFVEPAQGNYSRTAECAYYKAEARGFESGHEVEDWLEAEAELLQ
ncbi:MAG: DUF2934 domain-containing protein [Methylotenera sp.]|jgi:hypothetical protein|nr:DUF2934 domain-containing protein [Methylotenera sp.]